VGKELRGFVQKANTFYLNRGLVVTAKVYGTGNYCSSNNFICCERNRGSDVMRFVYHVSFFSFVA